MNNSISFVVSVEQTGFVILILYLQDENKKPVPVVEEPHMFMVDNPARVVPWQVSTVHL